MENENVLFDELPEQVKDMVIQMFKDHHDEYMEIGEKPMNTKDALIAILEHNPVPYRFSYECNEYTDEYRWEFYDDSY